MRLKARLSHDCGLLPLPKGEGWGEGSQPIDRSSPSHPHPLPVGERESRRAVVGVCASHICSTFAATLLFSLPCPAAAQSSSESFYKDQRVRMLVGYGVGTGNDLYLRLLARHIGKFIPGKPTMVPENMPGAGGIVMFNYL